jgi:hypothetical protein
MTQSRDESEHPSSNRSLYHYTTAEGLKGILETLSLWGTDVRFLNDALETKFARDLMADAVLAMENPASDPSHFAHAFSEQAFETFNLYRTLALEAMCAPDIGVYVVCFCELGDMLSQWRGYGLDHGYAIEFDLAALEDALANYPHHDYASGITRLSYGIPAAFDVISVGVEEMARFNLNHPGVKAEYMALQLTSMLATIKHPSFEEEREWRLYTAFQSRSPSDFDSTRDPIKFRSTPMAIVPYIEVPFDLSAIKSVRVGPGVYSEVRELGVRQMLLTIGSEAEVLISGVPLRT